MEISVYDGDLRKAPTSSVLDNDYILLAVFGPHVQPGSGGMISIPVTVMIYRPRVLGCHRPLSRYGISGQTVSS